MVEVLVTSVPVLVAVVGLVSAVSVAKINKMQKSFKTNHGTVSPGDSLDKLQQKLDEAALDRALTKAELNRISQAVATVGRDMGHVRTHMQTMEKNQADTRFILDQAHARLAERVNRLEKEKP